ncbi:thiopurine S-methyltransferase [Photobacterium aquimaris]|uniref:Thiopurine S-methyltransferase n=1 Tax=Photobacterium aquimaris TaxID=512643 RepID=A0A1Y6KTW3_9GAMM|nr:thiopurine S-methyltransferase [Photobacterium aquimaris]SMY15623.1 Thiopurine S-methyltransferase [Photobacterium aquimaris]
MDAEFWHSRWAEDRIGFHLTDVNPLLVKYWPRVNAQRDDRVLVPMCGKSEDLVWLATHHNDVVGIELSDIAVKAFFAENLYTPLVTGVGSEHVYSFDEITIYQGDYFTVPVAPVDVVYDRAALIAMPQTMRERYVERLLSLVKPGGRVLLITLDYPQSQMDGPPFSVPEAEIATLFKGCKITHLARDDADENHPRRRQGVERFAEEVWLIEV